VGFDAYKRVCDLPDIDVVLIASPGLFHPEHLKYAVEQGKHVFCEKPAAVDAAGYRKFLTTVRQAQSKNLCIMTGTMLHHHRPYVESYRKIQEGYIGQIVSGNVYTAQGHSHYINRKPEWTDMEYMIRDHFSWRWLSGDILVDQLVHYIDVFTWFSHLKPVQAFGTGARIRKYTGNIYDNFSIDFEYEGGVHVHGIERQINNCGNRVGAIIQGTKGTWNGINDGGAIYDLKGDLVWKYDDKAAKEQFEQHDPYTLEHVNFVNHLRRGTLINIAETTAISTMACIMALESAYTGKIVTWDEMIQSDTDNMPSDLKLENVDMEKYKTIPLPGTV
jgi:predicted dehydrogenase